MTLKISISGVRGHVPESLTPEVCLELAKAFGTYLFKTNPKKKKRKVVVGCDPRKSSEPIKGIVFEGLLSTGCEVIDIGICPTPTVGIMIKELKADGGMVVTASHNPLPWNGLKFMRQDGIFLNEKQANEFLELYYNKDFVNKAKQKVLTFNKALDIHIKKVLKQVKPKTKSASGGLKVVVDCCNGAGSVAAVKLLKQLGCIVFPLNCRLDLPFPHDPEPIAKNLTDLMSLVKIKKADIGFALDSDADRLAIVSEKGKAIGEELTLSLAAKYILRQNPKLPTKKKIIVSNLSTTKAIDDIAKEFKGTSIRTKIGEVHVAETLKKLKGLIGGEGNGGVIYPPVCFNRDSLTGIAIIISYLASSNKSLSALADEIPAYQTIKTKISCENQQQADAYVQKVKEKFKERDLLLTEGVKVMVPDGWVHVRASNTEPILRIIAEAKTKADAQRLIDQATL